ncbi:helix-turn-helix transcriptional regulator [Bradyrhizobium sp.]|uniref:helix-turn-helix transcriptional regulator n=1 Tax=Bradyrhizobium sp. TaxID=376 RepID=UPI003C487F68
MENTSFEHRMAERFGLDKAPTAFAHRQAAAPIAFTRIRSGGLGGGPTKETATDASVCFHVALAPQPSLGHWLDRKYIELASFAPGDVVAYNLSTTAIIANMNPKYDNVRFDLPLTTFDQLAQERAFRRVGKIHTTPENVADPVIHGLARAVLPAIEDPGAVSALYLDSIALAFHEHVFHHYGNGVGGIAFNEGLAPWQLRRVEAFIDAHLGGDPSVADLAKECGLSAGYFARAFRRSTGISPHRWLIGRRIERAKELLSKSELSLAEIALACGFADQSHFTRAFTRLAGEGPGKWRRYRCDEPPGLPSSQAKQHPSNNARQ